MATYGAWLREQIGRDDLVGQLAQLLTASGWPRAHSVEGLKSHIEDAAARPEWAMEAHAAAVAEYRRRRGDLQTVPRMGDADPQHPAVAPEHVADVAGLTENRWRQLVWDELSEIKDLLATMVAELEPADILDWEILLAMADFEGLAAEDAAGPAEEAGQAG